MHQERSRPAARRKLFRCALRIPLPRQAVVPLRKRLCLALWSSLRPMSVPAVCPDSLATKFKRRNIMSSYKNNVHLEGNLGKDAEKKSTPNGDVVNFSTVSYTHLTLPTK